MKKYTYLFVTAFLTVATNVFAITGPIPANTVQTRVCGIDNSGTSFKDTNVQLWVRISDSFFIYFEYDSATSWEDQVNKMAAGLDAKIPWDAKIEQQCPDGCYGLPQPDAPLNAMHKRFVGFSAAVPLGYPTAVFYHSDQRSRWLNVVSKVVELEPELEPEVCIEITGVVTPVSIANLPYGTHLTSSIGYVNGTLGGTYVLNDGTGLLSGVPSGYIAKVCAVRKDGCCGGPDYYEVVELIYYEPNHILTIDNNITVAPRVAAKKAVR